MALSRLPLLKPPRPLGGLGFHLGKKASVASWLQGYRDSWRECLDQIPYRKGAAAAAEPMAAVTYLLLWSQ